MGSREGMLEFSGAAGQRRSGQKLGGVEIEEAGSIPPAPLYYVTAPLPRRAAFRHAAPQNPRSERTSGESRSFSKARSRICRMRSRVTPSSAPIFSSVSASDPSSRP